MNFASTCKAGGFAQIPFSLVVRYNFNFFFKVKLFKFNNAFIKVCENTTI